MGNKSAKRASGFLGTSALTRPLFALGAATALLGAGPAYAIDANTLPQGPNVVGGKDSFAQSGNTLNVNQSTKRTVIDWRSFDIGSKAQVNFSQPGTSSIAVNRVNSSANPTQIEGGLHANGQVWILNPNGVFFGKTAHVDAAGVVASTANIDTKAFMAGSNTLQMTGADHGAVENQGNISVGQAGLAAFVAPSVRNSGTINATVGKVALAAGTTYTLDLAGDHLVELGLGSVKAVVDNSGKIVNPGGTIALTAKAASQVVSSVVNVSGTVSASSVTKSGGTITLGGDNVTTTATAQLSADAGTNGNGGAITSVANNQGNYAGSFSAKGGSQSGNGGSVETSGKSVHVDSGIKVNTLASNGKTGNWTLDPDNLMVQSGGSGSISSGANDEQSIIDPGTVVTALNSTDVTLQARNSISVEDAIDASSNANKHNLTLADQDADNNLTINLDAAITLKAGATLSGQGTVVNVTNTGKIQNGIDVALAGGATVNVAPGTYNEDITISKPGIKLLSTGGSSVTTIQGFYGTSAQGTIYLTPGSDNTQIGDIGHGFHIIGFDGTDVNQEKATIYIQATSGSSIIGNEITAAGEDAILSEYGSAITNLTIDSNTIDGTTFAGSNPDTGSNAARNLVYVSGASGGANKQNIVFTNNIVTGVSGGYTISGQEQGNSLVTIDAAGATITGNTFAGTTTYGSDALRGRGTNTVVTGNTFDGTNMAADTNMLELNSSALVGTFSNLIAANTWTNGSVWIDHAINGVNYVFRGIQNAVTGATSGDTINVGAGTYADTVTIDKGLTLAGAGMDETYLTGGIHIPNSPAITGLTFTGFTVSGDGGSNTVVRQGNVTNFSMDHVRIDGGSVAGRFGFAAGTYSGDISITNSEFVNIRGWAAFDTHTSGGTQALTSVVFSNNLLDNTVGDITFRQASPYVGVTITNNIVRNVGDSTDISSGIFKVFGASTVDFSGNNISGVGASPTKFTSGIADGAALLVNGVTTLNVTNNIFTDNQEAILVGDGTVLPTTTTLTGNTFTNNAYDIQLAGGTGAGTLNFGTGNNFISGAQTQQHLLWGGTSNIDMTQVQFDGKLGSQMSNDELFAAEDLITDGLDNAADGFARIKAGNVYVTAASGSIQNGVTKASVGDTVNVQAGTYGAFGNVYGDPSNLTIQTTEGAVIDGSVLPADKRIVELSGDGMTLSGFTINGTGAGVGISIDGQGVTVSGNTINNVGTGIQTHNTGNATITGNTITAAYGVSLQSVGNTVSGNTVTASAEGVGLLQSANTFSSNTFNIGAAGNALDYYGSAAAAGLTASGNTVNIQGGGVQGAVDLAGTDGALNLAAGAYTLPGQLDITKSLTLKGAGSATVITSNSTGYGINVTADNVSLQNFTYHGPTGTGSTYGIKVTPADGSGPTGRLLNFDIENVTIDRGYRTGLDLNGVLGATIKNVNISNIAHGNGIALTDSANVTITGSTTTDNAWGGLALYQTNTAYDQQVNNIVVDGTNTFNDTIPVYAEDQSDGISANGNPSVVGGSGLDFGTITLAGFDYVVQSPNNVHDIYSWFQKTKQAAFDFATNTALSNNNVNAPTATVQGYGGSGAYGNNTFYVGTGSNSVAMSIGSAVSQATTGGTVNVDAGTYAEDVAVGTQLSFNFGGSGVTVNSLTVGSGGAGSTLGGNLTATGAVALNGATTVNGNLKAASFTSGSTLALVGDLTAADGVTFGGASTVTGDIAAKTFTANGALALNGDLSASGAALFNGASSVNGNIQAASITANGSFGLNGNAKASGAIALNGANTLSGNLTGGSIALGATTLAGSTSLNTSGSNGAIQVASVNGNQALSLNAGTGTVSLGNVGATTRLASLSDASKTTLTGSTYNAGSLLFGGDVTLTAATTTLSTGGGDITFKGDIFGTADGAQSLVLSAGTGTGSPSANGNITLDNAGTSAVWLGDVTVSGNNFTADTVYVGGNYTSTLTGNQVFAADTLHTRGNVDSTVGGDASGHIDADGDVNINAGGDVSGTIGGNNVTLTGDDVNANVTAQNNATITGNTVEGSYNAGNTAGIVAHDNVNAAVNATNLELAAAGGSVDGTWTNYTITGSGIVYLNGDPQIGVNPAQLVVEGFTLPAGTTIGANGQLILPQGVLLGLLSPGGGKPKMILVHTVQELGQLLADGYSVIVIDLSGKDKDKPIQLASN